jgi:hypothetical protein
MSCRKALMELDRREAVKLPPARQKFAGRNPSNTRVMELSVPEMGCELVGLGQIDILLVPNRYSSQSRVWNALMQKYHYLGDGPLCGAQIRYLIRSSERGWLGGLSFSSAAWRLKDRDKWIGWSESARRVNLHRVVCNSRFLIIPRRVENLASLALSRCMKRLPRDWQERYGYTPVLVETFVDPEKFQGTCYRAANWVKVGQSSGRRSVQAGQDDSGCKKDIYLYPLSDGWKEILCQEMEVPLGAKAPPDQPIDWAEAEFGRVDFYDPRLRERLFTLARDFSQRPGDLVPHACQGSKAKIKGAYRFFDNAKVGMETVIKPHVEATIERLRQHRVVLAVQDTTVLNYTAHPTTDDLGPIYKVGNKVKGLILHDTLAFDDGGTPLGLVDVQCWARDEKTAGKRYHCRQLPREQKESLKWFKSYRRLSEIQRLCPKTMLVSVADREADIFDLFYEAAQNASGPQLLIRAQKSRKRPTEQGNLWEEMDKKPVAGFHQLEIPRKGKQPRRVARLAIRFARVTLRPPQRRRLNPVPIWAVYACEVTPPPWISSPLDWMLLTTVEVATLGQALERMRWYTRRWGIEVYHRTLKTGCRIEDRRLNNAARLEACLAIDMVVAWRVFHLSQLGREKPEAPCTEFFTDEQWKALSVYVNRGKAPKEPPTLHQAVRQIASLGGFIGRKGDGEPGTITLWRGIQHLDDLAEMYLILTNMKPRGP